MQFIKFSFSFLLLLGLTACGTEEGKNTSVGITSPDNQTPPPATADASFTDGMVGTVFQNYLYLRDALVQTDASAAKDAAGKLADALDDNQETPKNLAIQITRSSDIGVQRAFFEELTKDLGPLFRDQLESGTIYKQYCPMAFDNRGAEWFSEVEQIANPYFGDKMLRCGKVTEVIN